MVKLWRWYWKSMYWGTIGRSQHRKHIFCFFKVKVCHPKKKLEKHMTHHGLGVVVESRHTNEVIVSSNLHADMVRTTIVYPTMVEGLETFLYGYPKRSWSNMSVVFKALSVEKCLPSKWRSSSRFIIFCAMAIGLVNRMNKHYIHVGPFEAGVLLLEKIWLHTIWRITICVLVKVDVPKLQYRFHFHPFMAALI